MVRVGGLDAPVSSGGPSTPSTDLGAYGRQVSGQFSANVPFGSDAETFWGARTISTVPSMETLQFVPEGSPVSEEVTA
jgi:hypothetical protein